MNTLNNTYAPAFNQGISAYRNGLLLGSNPYTKEDDIEAIRHEAWLDGWLSEKCLSETEDDDFDYTDPPEVG